MCVCVCVCVDVCASVCVCVCVCVKWSEIRSPCVVGEFGFDFFSPDHFPLFQLGNVFVYAYVHVCILVCLRVYL